MATHRIPITGFGTVPDDSALCFFERYSITNTNDLYQHTVISFDGGSTDNGIFGTFEVPQNYVGTANVIIKWTSTATAGNVRWQFNYRAIAAGESLDQATHQESVEANDAAPGTTDLMQVHSDALTDANFAAGDLVEFSLVREASDTGNDTMAAAATVHAVHFEYADA